MKLGKAPAPNTRGVELYSAWHCALAQVSPSASVNPYQEFIMSIRKSIAAGLIVAANAVAKDKSKERAQKWVRDTRRKLARAIEPKG